MNKLFLILLLALSACTIKIVAPENTGIDQTRKIVNNDYTKGYIVPNKKDSDPYDKISYAIAKTKAPIILVGEFHDDISSKEITLHSLNEANKRGIKRIGLETNRDTIDEIKLKYSLRSPGPTSQNPIYYAYFGIKYNMVLVPFDPIHSIMNNIYKGRPPLKIMIGKEREDAMVRTLINELPHGKIIASIGVLHMPYVAAGLKKAGIKTLNINTVEANKLKKLTGTNNTELNRRADLIISPYFAIQAY